MKELTYFCIVPHFRLNAMGSDAFYAKKATYKNVLMNHAILLKVLKTKRVTNTPVDKENPPL